MKVRQRKAIEKITGKNADYFNPVAIQHFFAFTDRGVVIPETLSAAEKENLEELLFSHKHHPYIIEEWKKDFKSGLLFLSDFEDTLSPEAYKRHVLEIYLSVNSPLPTKYVAYWNKFLCKPAPKNKGVTNDYLEHLEMSHMRKKMGR